MKERSIATTGQVQSLVRALTALETLSEYPDGLTLTELARLIELPRSTTHRLLTTMHGVRFLTFESDTNRWRIGPAAFRVGAAFGGVRDLAKIGQPFLRVLNKTSHETVNLVRRDDRDMVYVGQHRSAMSGPLPFQTGDTLPLHLGAAGRSMMAWWTDKDLTHHLATTDFSKRTEKSVTDIALLNGKLERSRQRGYAFDCEESDSELRCVGAPIFDAYGDPVAAISISAPVSRMEKPRMHALGRELCATALKVTHSIGGRVPEALYG